MKFAKYYNSNTIVKKMIEQEEIRGYPSGNSNSFEGIYVCMDTNDFWISRINKGYNENYEKDDTKYLIERNRFSIYDVADKLHNMFGKSIPQVKESNSPFERKNVIHSYFNKFTPQQIIRAVIALDDEDGLSNWDCCETNSLEEAIRIIDGGFGIEESV